MIISIIQSVVSQMKHNDVSLPDLVVGGKSFQNAIADNKNFKNGFVTLVTPIASTGRNERSGYKPRKFPLEMMFLFKSQLDWTPLQHDQNCIQPARVLVDQFIERLTQSEYVDEVDQNFSELDVINVFDVNASGIILKLTVKPYNRKSICLD